MDDFLPFAFFMDLWSLHTQLKKTEIRLFQSLNHKEGNLKMQLLINSGYYIVLLIPNSSTALKPGYRERLLQIPDRILRNPDLHNYVVLGGTSLEWIKAGIKRFISVNLFSKPFELFWIKMPNCTPYLNVLKELVERPEHSISVSDLTRNDNGICKCLYRISRQIATL